MLTREEAMTIYENEMKYFHETRNIQWKVNISIWSFLGAATYFIQKENIDINDYFLVILSIFIFILYFIFLLGNQRSLDGNKEVWNKIISELNKTDEKKLIAEINPKEISKNAVLEKSSIFWILLFLLITIFLWAILLYTNFN